MYTNKKVKQDKQMMRVPKQMIIIVILTFSLFFFLPECFKIRSSNGYNSTTIPIIIQFF